MAGFGFDKAWFAPHMNFRFPVHGKIVLNGIEMEVRHALEPWHVLGEEGGGGGTVRFVDSSVERLQIKVTGMIGERHAVACNGWKLPLPFDRHRGRICRRRALPRLGPAIGAAPDHSGAWTVDIRSGRHLVEPIGRRLHVPCRPSGRPEFRNLAGQLA